MALSANDIAAAATSAGFSGNDVRIAVAVALAESGGRPDATHRNSNGSTDYGLWQINSVHKEILSAGTWSNPTDNARMAYQVWKNAGGKWTPWTTYKTGAYLRFMTTPINASLGATMPASAGASSSSSTDATSGISDFTNAVSTPGTWWRFGYVVGGALLIYIAFYGLMKRTGMIDKAVKAVGPEIAKVAV